MVIPKKIRYSILVAALFFIPATQDAMLALALMAPCAIVFIYLAAHFGETVSLLATMISAFVITVGVYSCLNF